MTTTVAVFTRNLRVHDNPVLAAAARGAERTVPLFVLDERILESGFNCPNRARFLAESLADLDAALRARGGALVVRRGRWVEQVAAVAEQVDAAEVHLASDVSGLSRSRQRRLEDAVGRRDVIVHESVVTVLEPGAVTPSGNDHYAVFTPYHRAWEERPMRSLQPPPERVTLPDIDTGTVPDATEIRPGRAADDLVPGGENEARRRMREWLADEGDPGDHADVRTYDERSDDLGADGTSRLSPFLHFGCVSPTELVRRAAQGHSDGARAFVRQMAWRDFHHQVLAARPATATQDYRSRGDRWRDDGEEAEAWRRGRTGFPIVDAGMRQLAAEGWMHNRARLIVGSFLTKTLYLDWRLGAQHFLDHLVDGDLANNQLNWQWVAGTGTDTRPHRVLNPLRQAERYDPRGDYVRRWVPELADLDPPQIHQPWRCSRSRDYPAPMVDLADATARFKGARGR